MLLVTATSTIGALRILELFKEVNFWISPYQMVEAISTLAWLSPRIFRNANGDRFPHLSKATWAADVSLVIRVRWKSRFICTTWTLNEQPWPFPQIFGSIYVRLLRRKSNVPTRLSISSAFLKSRDGQSRIKMIVRFSRNFTMKGILLLERNKQSRLLLSHLF